MVTAMVFSAGATGDDAAIMLEVPSSSQLSVDIPGDCSRRLKSTCSHHLKHQPQRQLRPFEIARSENMGGMYLFKQSYFMWGDTVDDRNPAPVIIIDSGFIHLRCLARFLNHQAYLNLPRMPCFTCGHLQFPFFLQVIRTSSLLILLRQYHLEESQIDVWYFITVWHGKCQELRVIPSLK